MSAAGSASGRSDGSASGRSERSARRRLTTTDTLDEQPLTIDVAFGSPDAAPPRSSPRQAVTAAPETLEDGLPRDRTVSTVAPLRPSPTPRPMRGRLARANNSTVSLVSRGSAASLLSGLDEDIAVPMPPTRLRRASMVGGESRPRRGSLPTWQPDDGGVETHQKVLNLRKVCVHHERVKRRKYFANVALYIPGILLLLALLAQFESSTSMLKHQEAVAGALLGQSSAEFAGPCSAREMWAFAEGDGLRQLAWGGAAAGGAAARHVVLGRVQLRLARVVGRPCAGAVRVNRSTCFPEWAAEHEDRRPFNASGAAPKYEWRELGSELKGSTVLEDGRFRGPRSFGTGGYSVALSRERAAAQAQLRELKAAWSGGGTRVVALSLNAYTPDSETLAVVQVTFSHDVTGHVERYARVTSFKLMTSFFHCTTSSSWAVLALWGVFSLSLLMVEFQELAGEGLRIYMRDLWNTFEVLYLGMTALLLYQLYQFQVLSVSSAAALSAGDDKFVDLMALRSVSRTLNLCMGGIIFMSVAKFCKFLRLSQRMNFLWRVLELAFFELVAFLVILGIILVAFAATAHTVFGSATRGHHSLGTSLMTMVKLALGGLESDTGSYDAMTGASSSFLPVFLVTFVFFVSLTSINLFIAILNDAHEKARLEREVWKQSELRRALLETENHVHYSLSDILGSVLQGIFPTWGVIMPLATDADDPTPTSRGSLSSRDGPAARLDGTPLIAHDDVGNDVSIAVDDVIRLHFSRKYELKSQVGAESRPRTLTRAQSRLQQAQMDEWVIGDDGDGVNSSAAKSSRRGLVSLRVTGRTGLLGAGGSLALLEAYRKGEAIMLEEDDPVLGNSITLEFMRSETKQFYLKADAITKYKVVDQFAEFRVTKVRTWKSYSRGPGKSECTLCLDERLRIPKALSLRLWYRSLRAKKTTEAQRAERASLMAKLGHCFHAAGLARPVENHAAEIEEFLHSRINHLKMVTGLSLRAVEDTDSDLSAHLRIPLSEFVYKLQFFLSQSRTEADADRYVGIEQAVEEYLQEMYSDAIDLEPLEGDETADGALSPSTGVEEESSSDSEQEQMYDEMPVRRRRKLSSQASLTSRPRQATGGNARPREGSLGRAYVQQRRPRTGSIDRSRQLARPASLRRWSNRSINRDFEEDLLDEISRRPPSVADWIQSLPQTRSDAQWTGHGDGAAEAGRP